MHSCLKPFARERKIPQVVSVTLELLEMGKAANLTLRETAIIASVRNEGKSLAVIARLVKSSKTEVFQALAPANVALRDYTEK